VRRLEGRLTFGLTWEAVGVVLAGERRGGRG
jgi:hypothetical protein